MNGYEWIFFDADETLFHFDAFRGLQAMFLAYGIIFTEQHFLEYQAINKPLWVDYQNGLITSKQLQCQRFDYWAAQLNISAQLLNSAFLAAMLDICEPIDGALNLLTALKASGKKVAVITNGFTELQQARLERTGFDVYVDFLLTSEQVNSAKPHRSIFDHALLLAGNPKREHVLMVGDTTHDLQMALNAGCPSVGVSYGAHEPDAFAPWNPRFVAHSVAELHAWFKAHT